MTTGLDLRVERVKAGATQRDIGRYMGVSAARVSVIERGANTRGTGIDPDTEHRYREAVKALVRERESGEPQSWQVEIVAGLPLDVQEQYKGGKSQARFDARAYPSHRTVEVKIAPTTPAATVIGYLDGLEAAGVSPRLLDASGTIVNRRIG